MPKKNTAQFTLFPEIKYEYHVFVSPPKSVIEDVAALKSRLKAMIGLAPYNEAPAHITLASFEAYESADVRENIRNAVSGMKVFPIKVDGYSVFESSNTIHLNIINPEPLDEIAYAIKSQKKVKKAPRQTSILDPKRQVKRKPLIVPHITIARNIPESDYGRIGDFSPFEYTTEWICDKITVRRRISGSDTNFKAYADIKLM
ncbi:MAG: 2'-5' RNA ligase family protein [Flavobacterium sp.]